MRHSGIPGDEAALRQGAQRYPAALRGGPGAIGSEPRKGPPHPWKGAQGEEFSGAPGPAFAGGARYFPSALRIKVKKRKILLKRLNYLRW